jgi:uncharacterized OB-fold protein
MMVKKSSGPRLVLPLAMDFCSPQTEDFTRISNFFDELRKGKFVTTKCKKCGTLSWPPRVVCPECQSDELRWVILPKTGKLWAFTELCMGAPMGMEQDLPFSIGIVELDKIGLRLLTRIDTPFKDLKFDMPMELVRVKLPGDKVFFRFRAKRKR